MLTTIALILLVLVAALLAYAATKLDTFRVTRSMNIKAPPGKIVPLITDLHAWRDWSPYENKDPNLKRTYGGAEKGVGATYEYEGNTRAVGAGKMEIVEVALLKVRINLQFIKPFEANNMVDFTLVPNGDFTDVTWGIEGPMPYMSKVMCLFFNMDNMVGKDFEIGLANLKALGEK